MTENTIKDYGFRTPKIETDHWIYGASPLSTYPDVLPSGDWRPYKIAYEYQAENFETYGCTVYGGENQIEFYLKMLTGIEHNYDERYNYNLIRIDPIFRGADPQLFYESVRNDGLTEGVLPPVKTISEFMSPRPIPEDIKIKGRKWEWNFNHAWLWTNGLNKEQCIALLTAGLKKSPVAVSVTAWMQDENGLYIDNGMPNSHWCICIALDGDKPVVYDTYDQSIKTLHPDHNIQVAKVIYLTRKLTEEKRVFFLSWLKDILVQLGIIQQKVNELKVSEKPVSDAVSPPITQPLKVTTESVETVIPIKKEEFPRYQWDTIEHTRISVRKICDEEELTLMQKNETCDICGCESGFNIKAIGRIDPRDRGLFQWNSKWHPEITDEIAFNPEKNARLGARAVKAGKAMTFWSASAKCWNKGGKYNNTFGAVCSEKEIYEWLEQELKNI